MKMIALLEKLEMDAAKASRRKIEEDRLFAIELKSTPEAKLRRSNRELRQLQNQTATLKAELKVREQLEAEYQRHAELSLQLKEANMSANEREQRDNEVMRMRTVFSRVCPEAASDWREQANLEFQSRYSPNRKKV